MLARVRSATVVGIEAAPIDVEVDVALGLPCCNIVGLADAGVREGRVRIRSALENSGFKLPPRKITVNLAPADLKKDGAGFDLPIAVGMLCAAGVVEPEAIADTLFVGELALDGAVRPVRGVLPIAVSARARGARRLIVPPANEAEAAVVGGCEVRAARDLTSLVALLKGEGGDVAPERTTSTEPANETTPAAGADLSEVHGQEVPRRALEIAAAGGHNLLFVGPPGSGKTMLARRLPGILPPFTFEEALETSMIYSIVGQLGGAALLRERPFRAPHHTVTAVGLVGGGPIVRPGEITLAHNGVLFLDELLEFARPALEALRQPLEDRHVAIVRARRSVTYPADFMLVTALNPCPCGHLGNPLRTCTCSLAGIAAYRARLSGPLVDRIDLHVEVAALPYQALARDESAEPSAAVRARVVAARAVQNAREGAAATSNARLPAAALRAVAALDADGHRLMEAAVARFGLSARALTRVRRVARTIADLDGSVAVRGRHVAEALQYRLLDRTP
ncbi:MAG TPA: YifB family Mg chelatase-like AAA ATPase [Polyangia bacterium]|nr:YifB family Mg chelatase-like AAA ATPase [Polyangia bacterium]